LCGFEADKYGLKSQHARHNLALSHQFQPIAIETLGGLGTSTVDFLKALGTEISHATGEKNAAIFLRQRLGIAVQTGNAAAILESLQARVDPLGIEFD
jgi:D-arabinose 1-dehydrogenase-like Zn-dependent alcohol dehydrogenase